MSGCACCGTDMAAAGHEARGLCEPCYKREDYHGRLADYPRATWSRDDLMTEWELLRSEGYSRRDAADRLGVKWEAFDRAYYRARAAGDPRAVPAWTATTRRGDAHAMAR